MEEVYFNEEASPQQDELQCRTAWLPGYKEAVGSISVGQMIEAELRRQGRSVVWLSRQLHCDRRNVYDIFKRASIESNQLAKISLILRTNFFTIYHEAVQSCIEQYYSNLDADNQ